MTKKKLIIIPGLGDRVWAYRFFRPIWSMFGFNVDIYCFGWEDGTTNFAEKMRRLATRLNMEQHSIYLIGVSAGGTAAINALAVYPGKLIKIATIATPSTSAPELGNTTLDESVTAMQTNKNQLDFLVSKIVSVYGYCDHKVRPQVSIYAGIQSCRIMALGHGLSIFLGLTLCSRPIRRFFRD